MEFVVESWDYARATYLLIGINCLVFVAMLIGGVSWLAPTPEQLMNWGANNSDAVLVHGQWWRIVAAMFVHVGVLHLLTNMWGLWNLGLLGEPLLGPFGVVAAYVLAGAAGNMLSVGVNQAFASNVDVVGAGASGAVFGLAGLLIVLLRSPRLKVPAEEIRTLLWLLILFVVSTFAIGFGLNYIDWPGKPNLHIDNMAHVGGLLGGFLFALPLVPRQGSERDLFLVRRRIAVGLVTAVLVLFGFYLSSVFP